MARMQRSHQGPRQAHTTRAHYDPAALKQAAAGRWLDILPALGGIDPALLDGAHHPCPRCGGNDRFRLVDEDAGALYCNQCFSQGNGDGLAALQWLRGWSFVETLTHLAKYLGVAGTTAPLSGHAGNGQAGNHASNGHAGKHASTKKITDPAANLTFQPWSDSVAALFFCRAKRGVTPEALRAFGARLATYRGRYSVVALPVRTPAAEIVGWVIYEQSGKTLPAFHGPGKAVTQERVILTAGSKAGLIAPDLFFDEKQRDLAAEIWNVEGPTDALALWAAMSAAMSDQYGNAVGICTNSSGAQQNPRPEWLALFAGRAVNVIRDADQPGEAGAAKWVAGAIKVSAGAVRHLKLPYPVEPSHGKDLRDYINESPADAWQRLTALAVATPPTTADALPAAAAIEAEDDPHRLARLWLAQQPGPVKYWRCDYYQWAGDCYKRLADEQLMSELGTALKEEFDRQNLIDQEAGDGVREDGKPREARKVTSALLTNVRLAVNSLAIVASAKEPPAWLDSS